MSLIIGLKPIEKKHETFKNIPTKRFIEESGWLTFDSSPAWNNWIVKEKIM